MADYKEYDNISVEDAQKIYEMAQRNEILGKYVFPKKPGKDGFYRINVKDATKKTGRKSLSAKTLDELADKVILHEKGIEGMARKTFKRVFELSLTEKLKYITDEEKKLSARNTMLRDQSEYKRFFAGSAFEKMYIDDITKKDIENHIYATLTSKNLKKKAFASYRSILNAAFKLAYEESWIKDNVYSRINFKKYMGMLAEDTPIEERIHSEDDVKRILDYLRDYHIKKPSYIPAYALEMQILMGMRRGEVPPLEWSDIHDTYVSINKEQLTVKKTATVKEHFVIVHHTKTWKDRMFPITDALNEFLAKLKDIHDRYYRDSPYLFPADSDTGVITNNAVYNFYRRMCRKLNITVSRECTKGTHSFRRNAITDVVNATNGNILLASQIFGNTPEVAMKNYYTGADMEEALKALNTRELS